MNAVPLGFLRIKVIVLSVLEQALETEKTRRERGVTISDPVQAYDDFYVGSFLDSEGNKLWICSPE
jgi:hypothetical protein